MARYTGPKLRLCRRIGEKLGLKTNEEAFTRRPYRPGDHGTKNRRGHLSEYGTQLLEKQKAKYIYGILERQFSRYYKMASKAENIGLSLLQILETRLDTVVFRAGLAITQSQARQFVGHGHIMVDGKKVSIPSFQVKPGMIIKVSKCIELVVEEQRSRTSELPNWIKADKYYAQMLALPERDQISNLINEQVIIEYYSR